MRAQAELIAAAPLAPGPACRVVRVVDAPRWPGGPRAMGCSCIEGTGRLDWTEELVLGRHEEPPGRVDLRLDVEHDGAPLLRHELDLGADEGWDGPAVLGGHRCVGLVLHVGARARSPAVGVGWVRMMLEQPAELILAVANDRPALRRALAAAER